MFEFSVACKYLLPRRRQLSVSIISLISVLVISLVVWLVVVFFSVTEGLERNWVNKLIALTAPIRATPTEAYYRSYYHLVDGISEKGGYRLKTIGEKRKAAKTDPYDPEIDQEIPANWPQADRDEKGRLKDPVKLFFNAVNSLKGLPGLQANDYEVTGTQLSIETLRPSEKGEKRRNHHSTLNYQTYLTNFEKENKQLSETLLPLRASDLNNLLFLIGSEDKADQAHFHHQLERFFSSVEITQLKPEVGGWKIPEELLPNNFKWKVLFIVKNDLPLRAFVPKNVDQLSTYEKAFQRMGLSVKSGEVMKEEDQLSFSLPDLKKKTLPANFPLLLAEENGFKASLLSGSLNEAKALDALLFSVRVIIQGFLLEGEVSFRGLQIAEVEKSKLTPLFVEELRLGEEGILLPKGFKESGILVGDRGYLSYAAPTASLVEEQRVPIYVAGFYDQGIIPIGGKFVLAGRDVTALIHASHAQEETLSLTNGINIRFDQIEQAEAIKQKLVKNLKEAGIDHYWKVETYRDYEFTKEIIQELQSQKNLFSLIALVIIVIACSNIISMLVILVNDKKVEIGILRSMGATSGSIAAIFALSGALIGMMGSLVGIFAGIVTLHYIQEVTSFLSYLQGYEMFNASLYGELLPNKLSWEALSLVLLSTILLSFVAGIVPAIKASLLRPSQILRSSGG